MSRPLVLVPAYRLRAGRVARWERAAAAVPEPYLEAVARAGATPVMIPPVEGEPDVDALSSFDGLLLIGGDDVSPARYDAERHPETKTDDVRDGAEFALLRAAVDRGMPVLAICRGFQVVNVAYGGTLLQHLPEIPGLDDHGRPGGGGAAMHDVKVAADSRLAAMTGSESLACSSHHHQGIDAVGDGLVPVAWTDDGLVEAVEGADGWLVAVQWHPEDTAASDPSQQSLFDSLAERASAYASARG